MEVRSSEESSMGRCSLCKDEDHTQYSCKKDLGVVECVINSRSGAAETEGFLWPSGHPASSTQ